MILVRIGVLISAAEASSSSPELDKGEKYQLAMLHLVAFETKVD
jgi:hypothetical protein